MLFAFAAVAAFSASAFTFLAFVTFGTSAFAMVARTSFRADAFGSRHVVASLFHDFQLIGRSRFAGAVGAMSLESEDYSFNGKQQSHCGSPSASCALEARQPSVVACAECLECAPEAVSHVEPEGAKADEVDYENNPSERTTKLVHDLTPAVGCCDGVLSTAHRAYSH